jgi:hypothetical protein
MKLRTRLIFLVLFTPTLLFVGRSITGNFDFVANDFWFAAGLLLLVLISLIDQPFFSNDGNIFLNGTSALSLILIRGDGRDFWWYLFLIWCIWLMTSSFVVMVLNSRKHGKSHSPPSFVSKINREIGRPEAIFSAYFIWGAVRQFGFDSSEIEPLFWFWVVFMVVNIPSIARHIDSAIDKLFDKNKIPNEVATLYRISDPRVMELNINADAPRNIVGQSITIKTQDDKRIGSGIAIDDRTVAGNRIAKVAIFEQTSDWNYVASEPEKTVIDIQSQSSQPQDIPISVVDVGSTIPSLKFFVHPDILLQKGEIVWCSTSNGTKIYYQITLANIVQDSAPEGNITKSVLVTAGQLGTWDEVNLRFNPYPWVAPAGTLIYRVSQQQGNYVVPPTSASVGLIPNSDFPIHASIDDLVTHNTAIVGVTGSGKSYLAFHLIESLISANIKVLILDLTRQHYVYMSRHNPTALAGPQDVRPWIQSQSNLAIHQFAINRSFPQVTREFVEEAFAELSQTQLQAGVNLPARLCIVFEEAHSLIPEWNQVVIPSDQAQVNTTARTILQGRKFGLGSLIITQRTANVTKTVLNQCNTIVALRSFDQTGLDFLRNYMGDEYSQAISTLPDRDGIIVGKASSCSTPVIFRIPDYSNRWNLPAAP